MDATGNLKDLPFPEPYRQSRKERRKKQESANEKPVFKDGEINALVNILSEKDKII